MPSPLSRTRQEICKDLRTSKQRTKAAKKMGLIINAKRRPKGPGGNDASFYGFCATQARGSKIVGSNSGNEWESCTMVRKDLRPQVHIYISLTIAQVREMNGRSQ